jgi:hypothetical protein
LNWRYLRRWVEAVRELRRTCAELRGRIARPNCAAELRGRGAQLLRLAVARAARVVAELSGDQQQLLRALVEEELLLRVLLHVDRLRPLREADEQVHRHRGEADAAEEDEEEPSDEADHRHQVDDRRHRDAQHEGQPGAQVSRQPARVGRRAAVVGAQQPVRGGGRALRLGRVEDVLGERHVGLAEEDPHDHDDGERDQHRQRLVLHRRPALVVAPLGVLRLVVEDEVRQHAEDHDRDDHVHRLVQPLHVEAAPRTSVRHVHRQ